MKHIAVIRELPKNTPSTVLPDGAVTGNGDLALVWAGQPDRTRLYISKADFWKGEEDDYGTGGISPIGMIEILLPQLAYAPYHVEQNMDEGYVEAQFAIEGFDARIRTTVCATENMILIELDRTWPGLSVSCELHCIEGCGARYEKTVCGGVQSILRAFDDPELFFPTIGIAAMKEVRRVRENGRENILWAVSVATNHDSAACRSKVFAELDGTDERYCMELLKRHTQWWKDFWSRSGVALADEILEFHWYAGIYIMACCMRNKKFPPGLWGNFSTADNMAWHGDYHFNYNFEAPFYPLSAANHTELMDCYYAPIRDFLPAARRFAGEFLGCRGVYFPVGIGPLGLEISRRNGTKEHSHLFLGQKSNASYTAVIPVMRWYSTRDTDYAKEVAYPFLREIADFWEDYLVFRDGRYFSYNDALNEVEYYSGPDHMPKNQDDVNPIITVGLIKMVMECLLDMQEELGGDMDRTAKWKDIAEKIGPPQLLEMDGVNILRGTEYETGLRALVLQNMYPAGGIGQYSDPVRFEAARNSLERMDYAWDNNNLFCSFYPTAARLNVPPERILSKLHELIARRELPNAMFRFQGGGIENSAAVPATVNEMLMQSYEHILRLFPCWNPEQDASFFGMRAYGAFVVDAEMKNRRIRAEILSEKGRPLTIERPQNGGYTLLRGNGERIPLTELLTTVETCAGERLILE